MHLSPEIIQTLFVGIGGTAALGKLFLIVARSMPPLPANCGYFARWFYDAIQGLAENQDKVGKVQDPDKPVGQEKQTISASATTVEAPKGMIATEVDNGAAAAPIRTVSKA